MRQLAGLGAGGGQLGQRLLAEQRRRQAGEEVAVRVGRALDRPPPQADPFDDSGMEQHRQHTRPDQRRLATAGHAQDQHERPPRRRLLAERAEHLHDLPPAAEEDRGMLELEDLEPAEGRAGAPLDLLRHLRGLGRRRQQPVEQLAQMHFDQRLELGGMRERVKGSLQRHTVLADEPALDELVERSLLPQSRE